MPKSSAWSLPFRSYYQNSVHISYLAYACYMLHPSHPPSLDLPNNIWRSLQFMKLLIMQTFPASLHLLPLRSEYSKLTFYRSFCLYHFTSYMRYFVQENKNWLAILSFLFSSILRINTSFVLCVRVVSVPCSWCSCCLNCHRQLSNVRARLSISVSRQEVTCIRYHNFKF